MRRLTLLAPLLALPLVAGCDQGVGSGTASGPPPTDVAPVVDPSATTDTTGQSGQSGQAACWNPAFTGSCPEFSGADAALYVFSLEDPAATWCAPSDTSDTLGDIASTKCTVDGHPDLDVYIIQWSSTSAASSGLLGAGFQKGQPWKNDTGAQMGTRYSMSAQSGSEYTLKCYDDLPLCIELVSYYGDAGDTAAVEKKFGVLSPAQVTQINETLAK